MTPALVFPAEPFTPQPPRRASGAPGLYPCTGDSTGLELALAPVVPPSPLFR